MGSIPLVALMGRQPQILDYGQQMAQAQQIQAMKNQNALVPGQLQGQQNELQMQGLQLQQQKQQLADQQAATKAMQEWDGKDYGSFASLALKHGASASTVIGLKKTLLDQQESALKMTETQRAIEKQNADYFAQGISNVEALPPEQQPQAFEALKTEAVQSGRLDPQHAQQYQYKDPQQLEALRKLSIGHAAVMDEANKQAQTEKERQQGALAQAEIPGKLAAGQIQQQEAAMTPQERAQLKMQAEPTNIEMQSFLQNPPKGYKATPLEFMRYQKSIAPNITAVIAAGGGPAGPLGNANDQGTQALVDLVGQNKAKIQDVLTPRTPLAARKAFIQNVVSQYPDFDTKQYDVEKGVEKAFTSGQYSQQLNSINRAREHMGTFLQLADAMNNSDVKALNTVSNYFKTEFGSSAPGNLAIAKQAFAAEVGKAFAGQSVALADRQELDKAIDKSSSWTQFRDAASTADKLLAGAQKALKQTYESGKEGRPNFGETPTGGGPARLPSFKDWKASQKP